MTTLATHPNPFVVAIFVVLALGAIGYLIAYWMDESPTTPRRFLCRLGFHRPIGHVTSAFGSWVECHSCGRRFPQ